jgi:hypothetical protein
MPRRSILSMTERESLLVLRDTKDELIRLYTFNDTDLSRLRQHRGAANRPVSPCNFATCAIRVSRCLLMRSQKHHC